MKRSILIAATAALLGAGAAHAQQAAFPSRNLVFVVAFQAGSSSDAIVRFMAEKIKPMVKQTIVVENRPGASGAVATEYTLRSKPDGHTIFVHSPAAVAANDATMKTPPANTRNRLQVAATINRQAFMLAVHSNTPHKTLADLTAAMKAKGSKGTYATYAMTATIAGGMYKAATGIEAVEVVYRIGAHTLNDLESGVLDFGIYDPLFALSQERAGKFRLLAIVSPERMQTSPNVPTFREHGHDIVLMGYFSAMVPAETPKPVVAEINRLFSTAVAMEETKKFLNNIGSEPWINTPEKAQELYLAEFENYRKAVEIAKIERK